jgi:hypothetical protein
MNPLKEEYIKYIENELNIKKDDFSDEFDRLITLSFNLIEEKLDDMSLLNKEIIDKNIEIKNMKIQIESMMDELQTLKETIKDFNHE